MPRPYGVERYCEPDPAILYAFFGEQGMEITYPLLTVPSLVLHSFSRACRRSAAIRPRRRKLPDFTSKRSATPQQMAAILRAIAALCSEKRPDAIPLRSMWNSSRCRVFRC
jgi:hypothetical protein